MKLKAFLILSIITTLIINQKCFGQFTYPEKDYFRKYYSPINRKFDIRIGYINPTGLASQAPDKQSPVENILLGKTGLGLGSGTSVEVNYYTNFKKESVLGFKLLAGAGLDKIKFDNQKWKPMEIKTGSIIKLSVGGLVRINFRNLVHINLYSKIGLYYWKDLPEANYVSSNSESKIQELHMIPVKDEKLLSDIKDNEGVSGVTSGFVNSHLTFGMDIQFRKNIALFIESCKMAPTKWLYEVALVQQDYQNSYLSYTVLTSAFQVQYIKFGAALTLNKK